MISSNLSLEIHGFDEIISPDDTDFGDSGLKLPSLIRVGRLAVVNAGILVGNIGHVTDTRLARIRHNLSKWIQPASR